jgi:hypothetical protein
MLLFCEVGRHCNQQGNLSVLERRESAQGRVVGKTDNDGIASSGLFSAAMAGSSDACMHVHVQVKLKNMQWQGLFSVTQTTPLPEAVVLLTGTSHHRILATPRFECYSEDL